jgi:hypothetical protein
MPSHHHHHQHYHGGYYRRGPTNPICSIIYCSIFIGFFVFIIWNTVGFSDFGYIAPVIGIVIFVAISGIIAAIVNAVRRQSKMQAQSVGTSNTPQDYPPQGSPAPGIVGTAAPQPGTYSPATFQSVPLPRPVGITQAQAPVQAPTSPARFCTYCGTTVESNNQKFCANCGAEL